MVKSGKGQTELVEVRAWLPRYARDELDEKASRDGMRRSTYLRALVLRDLRRQHAEAERGAA